MRPLTLVSCLLLAALGGGATARFLTPSPADPTPAMTLMQQAADATLPTRVEAALPAQLGGAPMPSLAPMLEKAMPAVVNIYTKQVVRVRNPLAEFFGGDRFPQERVRQSLGSGVIIDATRGLILTNNHVVEGADAVSVTLADGRTFEAQPIGSDADTDIAVIRITATNLTAVPLSDSANLRVGDFVVAVGNPFGLGQTVTSGIVSAVGRSGLTGFGFQNFIQTDASINPGNSGGPLLNLDGQVIGINTAIIASGQGIGFAIPSSLAKQVIEQLKEYKSVKRGWLGVSIQDVDENSAKALGLTDTRGALVSSVTAGDPAEQAGIKAGDVIVAVEGVSVDDAGDLTRKIGDLLPGVKITLSVWRAGKVIKLPLVLGERNIEKVAQGGQARPGAAGEDVLGLSVRPVTDAEVKALDLERIGGLLVLEISESSSAAQNGLAVGDVILEANGKVVNTVKELREVIDGDGKAKGVVMLLIKRQGKNVFRTVPLS